MTGTVVVDSSAIIAILRDEPERAVIQSVLDRSANSVCSLVTFVESFMVVTGRNLGTLPSDHLELISSLGISLAPLDPSQANFAAQAFLQYGKGRHSAKLNLGDCFSYALAKSLNAPLLYKGSDFSHTDIVSAAAGARP
ncbi:MAG TPA: type II toxin-antitoxin system VapC family toxin [Bosea sp. (in: a-proteobacteria)]|jgi:ribonuclease VapC|uniref:type II toxin-antitoxin system VapC family toxin n=1 Tax=Bosea sp. (in: a-proteobacteria) TaxID=1871050 RepID=UPI002DDCB58A|nr:type II toxin-antitoxin system VapC family toxin [Bosea sp. (in: a-proteobacteria)]HEV2553962.1 type II toxin-antitoxin system VapC family toxin [Bosea sp. (in: a-proteobacteria)]